MPAKDLVRIAERFEAEGVIIIVVIVEGFAEEVLLVVTKDIHWSNEPSEVDLQDNVIGAGLPRRRGIRHQVLDSDARGLL